MRVVDFFSGCGGTSCGFRNAGCTIVAGIDNNRDAAATFALNFPEAVVFDHDVRDIETNVLQPLLKGSSESLLFSACAPCQPFSKQNRQPKEGDERIDLLDEFARFVRFYLPDFIFIENVPGIQKKFEGDGPLDRFLLTLKDLGYPEPSVSVIVASHYGVPQWRPRLMLLASKHGSPAFPPETHGDGDGQKPYTTVGDWIRNLPPLKAGERDSFDPDHQAASLSEKNLLRIRNTPEGGDRRHWPDELRLPCHRSMFEAAGQEGHTDVYGRLAFDKPASGLTTRCISYSNGRFGHPVQDRAISVREAACLQTFPRSFRFLGSLNSKARQIGNAVPPLLAKRIALSLLQSV